jgi:hypothetical protein
MVVSNFHFKGITIAPDKTNAPLVIDSNAVLAIAVTA